MLRTVQFLILRAGMETAEDLEPTKNTVCSPAASPNLSGMFIRGLACRYRAGEPRKSLYFAVN